MGWGLFIWHFKLGSHRCKHVYRAYPLVEGPRGMERVEIIEAVF